MARPAPEDILRHHGYRLTRSRRAVIEALRQLGEDTSPAAIYHRATELQPGTGRATVYRTLDLLRGLGLAHATVLGGRDQRFSIPSAGHHHHLVCTSCGTVAELEDCLLAPSAATDAARHGYRLQGHFVELYGRCDACR